MYKVPSVEQARAIATEKQLFYGWSVFTAGWFIGTEQELKAMGVHSPVKG